MLISSEVVTPVFTAVKFFDNPSDFSSKESEDKNSLESLTTSFTSRQTSDAPSRSSSSISKRKLKL